MSLIRQRPGFYTTPDGRYYVERGANYCAPRRWWAVAGLTEQGQPNGFKLSVATLKDPEQLIAWLQRDEP